MLLSRNKLDNKINDLEKCVKNYDIYIVILKHLQVKQNKDGTTHGGTDGEIYIPLQYLDTANGFYDYIEKRIAYFEKRKAEDKQKIIEYKKVFEQLAKINAYSLDAWEVKELL